MTTHVHVPNAYFPKLPDISIANPSVSQLSIYYALYNQGKQRIKEWHTERKREEEKEGNINYTR